MKNEVLILGAGITGLSAGVNSNNNIYEAKDIPGGICSSYYMNSEGSRFYSRNDEETYRFELGGGHWIFGADNSILNFINEFSPIKSYERKSAVYFPEWDLYVPYPLQNNLSYLPREIAKKALDEIVNSDHARDTALFSDWLELHFGKTLCELFFFPFHDLYTAGLFTKIEPQDKYKSPVNKEQILRGFREKAPPVGYNVTFVYPEKGLDDLIRNVAEKCLVNYNKKVIKIDIRKKEILFKDDTVVKYKTLISTLPLNLMLKLIDSRISEQNPPYTSVMVVNIGAKKGSKCPDEHWLYIPKSRSGFHRVGFYSNVDNRFLPQSARQDDDRVSIYVEKAFLPEEKPDKEESRKLCDEIIMELRSWKFIDTIEVIDPTWVEVAYTWQYPQSDWKERAIEILERNDIFQIGRYGRWKFQGIAKSIKDGLEFKND